MPTTKKDDEEAVKLTSILELDGGLAPKAQPEDTSELPQSNSENMALNPNSGEAGIQFIPAGVGGGNDAKVELGAAATVPAFVGLGKEELMKYANDPFWVRLRWILFILFWVVWLGMLVGAIVIIVLAPKCSDMTRGMKVVEEKGPFYQVYLSKFTDNGKLTGLAARADYLSKLGIRTIIISQPFETRTSNIADGISEVTNFTKIHPALGTIDDFTNVTQVLNHHNISVVLQVIPNHSSRDHPWFLEDANQFYVLRSKKDVEGSEWKSFYGDSAWKTANDSDPDGRRYLHQFRESEADLNYGGSEKVISMMNDVFKFWYNAGVDGFLISDVSYLVEDLSKLSDPKAMLNNDQNNEVVKKLIDTTSWKIPEDSKRKHPFALLDYNGLSFDKELRCGKDLAVPVLSDLQSVIPMNFTAADLEKHFGKNIGDRFVVRRLSGPRYQHLLSKYKDDQDRAHMLTMITFLVRGEVVVYNGDEFTFTAAQARNAAVAGDRLDVNRPEWSSFHVDEVRNYVDDLVELHNTMKKNEKKDDDDTHFVADNGVFGFRRVTPDRKLIVVANVNRTGAETSIDVAKLFGIDAKQGEVKIATPTPGGPTLGLPVKGNVVELNSVNLPLGKAVAILEGSGPLKTT